VFSFIETKLFSKLIDQYLSDEEYAELQRTLIADPEAGDLIPDSGGVRRIRWGLLVEVKGADCASLLHA
jgi:hypothetical protein